MKSSTIKPYDKLLSRHRVQPSSIKGRDLEEEADSDRGRVLFSAPFRRLQNKAQVFSLESNAAVRSRLTHSLEVSSIGRYITQQILKEFELKKQIERLGLKGKERPFMTFVETACLIHDIGNPPFGHFGERAICEWFKDKEAHFTDKLSINKLSNSVQNQWQQYYKDFTHFDGNPQGIRIMARLQQDRRRDPGHNNGANLTFTQIAACIKYPKICADALDDGGKKGGFFITESKLVHNIWSTLGMENGKRHPLVYIMEAADDIAYCLSDLEDGIEKAFVNPVEFSKIMLTKINKISLSKDPKDNSELKIITQSLRQISNKTERKNLYEVFWKFRSSVIRLLVRRASKNYVDYHDKILSGELKGLLKLNDPDKTILNTLNSYAKEYLYFSKIVRSREITAFNVLHGILDAHIHLLDCDKSRFEAALSGNLEDTNGKNLTVESSLASRLPFKYVDIYRIALKERNGFDADEKVRELVLRFHLILDYVSGMSDNYALRTYQLISGIKLTIDN